MTFIFPLALAAVTAFLASTGCDDQDEKIEIGPEPLPRRQVFPPKDMDLNNPIFKKTLTPLTEQTRKLFLLPFAKDSFQQDLSPQEQLGFRKLNYQRQRMEFFSEAYSFGKTLQVSGKVQKAQEVYQQLLEEKFPVPLPIREFARRDLIELYRVENQK